VNPEFLVIVDLPEAHVAELRQHFTVHYVPDPQQLEQQIGKFGASARAVLTNGITGLNASQLEALPRVELIHALGAGFEAVDIKAARTRNVKLSYGPNTNDSNVADHAFALLFALVRGIARCDSQIRQGEWPRFDFPSIAGKRLGILGLGNIGLQLAQRGSRGFDMPVSYHTRSPREDSPYTYAASVLELAEWSDYLVVACPGGPSTFHIVDARVLEALGPKGYLVNIARGTVVDTPALIDALRDKRIAGAALDVVEGQPHPPQALLDLPNTVFTPHIAGRSPEARDAMLKKALANLCGHFRDESLLTPVPA
jgi:lactate dehydrogenase-like 2-hydroxyacid dehydrogenase